MVVASAGWAITIWVGWAWAVETARASARKLAKIVIGLLPRRVYSFGRPSGKRRRAGPGSGAVADPGIEPAVQHVHGQVERHEQGRDEQDGALDEWIVPLVDGPEHEPPHAGQREDLFDHDRPAEQDAHLEPGDRDDRD